MKICGVCNGKGFTNGDICHDCNGEGIDSEMTFTRKKIVRKNTMKYQDYQAKKEKELSKVDKKNAREEVL